MTADTICRLPLSLLERLIIVSAHNDATAKS